RMRRGALRRRRAIQPPLDMKQKSNLGARHWGGAGLIVLGLLIGVGTYITIIGPIFGLALIAIGIYVIARTGRRQAEQAGLATPTDAGSTGERRRADAR